MPRGVSLQRRKEPHHDHFHRSSQTGIRLRAGYAHDRRLKHRQDRADFGGEDSYLLKVRRIGRDYPCGDDVHDGDSACISATTTVATRSPCNPFFPRTSLAGSIPVSDGTESQLGIGLT